MSVKRLNKRFYKAVTVGEKDGKWAVLLDGMQLRTPGKVKLSVPSEALAEVIAGEWEAQTEVINPSTMPVTRLTNVALEQTVKRRDDLVAEARRYAETDLISYRAPQPRILKERQAASWDVWKSWAAEQGVKLKSTETLDAIDQPTESLKQVESYAMGLSDLKLTLFVHLVAVYGSVVLAMAVMKEAISAEAAFDLSRVDADYQIELWGEDEEQAEITANLRAETKILGDLVSLL